MKDLFISLAKKTIETYIKTGKILPLPKNLPEKMTTQRTGTFVSIHKKDGSLRGCIGTFLPTKKNVAEEIIYNSISAATQDPRFPSVTEKELPNLVYSVDILSQPKPTKKENLDPKKYGLIVATKDDRRGLLLPDIPGVKTVEEQIEICKRKAGIGLEEKIKLEIFTVERHH
jgi:AmmeMemoRadiSam system protein A